MESERFFGERGRRALLPFILYAGTVTDKNTVEQMFRLRKNIYESTGFTPEPEKPY
jgi:hypothetical protein